MTLNNQKVKALTDFSPLPQLLKTLTFKVLTISLLLAAACGNRSSGAPDAGLDAGNPQSDGGASDAGLLPDGGPLPVEVRVRAILPGVGPTTGGGNAIVSGSGFVQGFAQRGGADVTLRTTLRIGGAAATSLDVLDDNRIELTIPAGAAGPADVSVSNPNGTGTCTGCFRYVTPVRVLSIAPAAGPSEGGTAVTIHGQGFTPATLLTLGGRELIQLQLVDAQTATGLTPRGPAGPASLLALTRDGRDELRSAFVYQDPLRVDFVDPGTVATAGGTRVTVSGRGFSPQAQVTLDGAPAATDWIDSDHLSAVAPAHAAGAVDVTVTEEGALSATLPHGLVYVDPGAPFALLAVVPAHGPLAGGACPATCVRLLGSGFTGATQVLFGAVAATLHPRDDRQFDVDLPAGAAPGLVDVTVVAGGAQQTLAQAFRYDALAVRSLSPASGPVAGGTAVTVSGTGLTADVRVGALPLTAVQVAPDGTSLTGTTAAGSPGLADLIVRSGDLEAILPAAFLYTAPLALAQVSPALGAQAGGTRISIYGRGFGPGLAASIDGSNVTGLSVVSPTEATGLTPPGTPGARPVIISLGGAQDTLASGFTYFDPASTLGGGSGGPVLGVLNVSVLEGSAYKKGGVPGASVTVTTHDGGQLAGLTDARGQITFSDDRLVLPSTVTADKPLYDAVTVGGVATASLSVYLSGPPGPPPPPPDPPPPPPPPLQPASISGHVFGFKLAPSTVLSATQRAVARVFIARRDINSLPPFSPPARDFVTVTDDGGAFSFPKLYSLDPTTLYAVFGIEDSATTPAGFEPVLLGILRAVQPNPAKPIDNADLTLDTHLDQSVDVTVLDPPSSAVGHDAAIDLDLGSAGVIPLDRVVEGSDAAHLHFRHLPAAAGQGFVFIDQAGKWNGSAIVPPVSTYLRRVFNDLSAGATLGPLLSFPVPADPLPAFDGQLRWSVPGSSPLQANLQQVTVGDVSWQVILPGDARAVMMPPELRATLKPGAHDWSITTSVAPGFDFEHWNYDDLYSSAWTAYAYASGSFTVPP
jgi:hypothetical protein